MKATDRKKNSLNRKNTLYNIYNRLAEISGKTNSEFKDITI